MPGNPFMMNFMEKPKRSRPPKKNSTRNSQGAKPSGSGERNNSRERKKGGNPSNSSPSSRPRKSNSRGPKNNNREAQNSSRKTTPGKRNNSSAAHKPSRGRSGRGRAPKSRSAIVFSSQLNSEEKRYFVAMEYYLRCRKRHYSIQHYVNAKVKDQALENYHIALHKWWLQSKSYDLVTPYPEVGNYQENHPEALETITQIIGAVPTQLLESQSQAKDSYREDQEESSGTQEDYLAHRNQK